jgi:hypothetical protein
MDCFRLGNLGFWVFLLYGWGDLIMYIVLRGTRQIGYDLTYAAAKKLCQSQGRKCRMIFVA